MGYYSVMKFEIHLMVAVVVVVFEEELNDLLVVLLNYSLIDQKDNVVKEYYYP